MTLGDRAVAIVATVVFILFLCVSPAQAATIQNGYRCTIVGSSGNDRLVGTGNADIICGLGGNDTLIGLGGNDVILGGAGNDTVDAGSGNDTVDAGLGNDTVSAGPGNDAVAGGPGADVLRGDAGNDVITGGDGNDQMRGGDGNDSEQGNAGNDVLRGDAGNDSEQGNAGNDGLIGGTGSDDLNGQSPGETDDPIQEDLCEPVAEGDSAGNCGFDEEPPVIASVEVSTRTIDTSRSKQTVTVLMHVTDELMGVAFATCFFDFENQSYQTLWSPTSVLRGGNDIDGWWSCSYTFPRFAATGHYQIALWAGDNTGKTIELHASNQGAWQSALGVDAPTNVTQTGIGDTLAPRVEQITFASTSPEIDSSAASRSVVANFSVSDDVSGVTAGGCSFVNRDASAIVLSGTMRLVSRRNLATVWKCTAVFPRYSPRGDWFLSANFSDASGRVGYVVGTRRDETKAWDSGDFDHPRIVSEIGRNFVIQAGLGDESAPELISVSANVTSVNTQSRSQTISVTYRAADDLAGVSQSTCGLSHSGTSSGISVSATRLPGGTPLSSEWKCELPLPKGSSQGDWILSIGMTDTTGRMKQLITSASGTWEALPSFPALTAGELSLPGVVVRNGP